MLIQKEEFTQKLKSYSNDNLWQTAEWGDYQRSIWKKVYSIAGNEYLSLLVKQEMRFGISYLHVQRWPLGKVTDEFVSDLIEIAKQAWCAFVRMTPLSNFHTNCKHFNWTKDIFPQNTLMIDLTLTEDQILQEMKQKWRYNIRLAQKKWVKVVEESDLDKASKIFYDLIKVTSKRDGFFAHSEGVYKAMIECLWDKVKVFVAYYEDKPISAWIFTYVWPQAIYYYWASSDEFRSVMAPYLVQWVAILKWKELWCTSYDFLGVAEDPDNKKDALHTVTGFKIKFWGSMIKHPACIDLPVSLIKYCFYRMLMLFK